MFFPLLLALLGAQVFALRTDEIGRVERRIHSQEPVDVQLHNAQEQLAKANKLLAEKTQGLTDAKKRGDELTIEEKHALTEAQQDAAKAQKVLAALAGQTAGTKPVEAVDASPKVKTVLPTVAEGSGQDDIEAHQRMAAANKLLAEKIQGLEDAKKRGEDLTIEEKHALTEAQQDAAEAQKVLAAFAGQTENTKPVEAVDASPEVKTASSTALGGSDNGEIDAHERLATANKLLAEKTQGLADAKKRGEDLTIEEKHALTEAQQDAAEAQKALASIGAQADGTKPTKLARTPPEATAVPAAEVKAVPAEVKGEGDKAEMEEGLAEARLALKAATAALEAQTAKVEQASGEKLVEEKHKLTELHERAGVAHKLMNIFERAIHLREAGRQSSESRDARTEVNRVKAARIKAEAAQKTAEDSARQWLAERRKAKDLKEAARVAKEKWQNS